MNVFLLNIFFSITSLLERINYTIFFFIERKFWKFQSHPWFNGVQWEILYQMESVFTPEIKDDLDTYNFDDLQEVCVVQFLYFLCPKD